MCCAFFTLKSGKNTTFSRSRTAGSLFTTSATALISLMMQLGHEVAGRGLGAEDERARRHVGLRVALEAQVEREDVQHVQVLPLVFVQALGLDVEERLRGRP